jgi:hypothetical protein
VAAIGTLEGLKQKLGIAESDTSRDDELELLLLAAQRYVLRVARFAIDDGDVEGELHENVREGDALFARVRPMDPDTELVVEGRNLGDTAWSVIRAEIIDPASGRLRIVNAADSPWPALNVGWSPWGGRRWRRSTTWPLVRLTYGNLGAPSEGLEDLALAVEVLAASWEREGAGSGALKGQTAGIVSEEYATASVQGSIPNAVALILAGFATSSGRARLSR